MVEILFESSIAAAHCYHQISKATSEIPLFPLIFTVTHQHLVIIFSMFLNNLLKNVMIFHIAL